jgi:hypothetical protein
MWLEILNRFLMMIFVLSLLNIFRTTFFLIGTFLKSNSETPEKFRLTKIELIFLGLSISYVITSMFSGIKF